MIKEDTHNGTTITFKESDHSYIDNFKNRYVSVTTLIHDLFPFDQRIIAEKLAKKYRTTPEKIIASWEKSNKVATDSGSALHRYAELNLLESEERVKILKRDRNKKRALKKFIKKLKEDFLILHVEKIFFSKELSIAGQVDLIVKCKKTGRIKILDWKTNEKIVMESAFDEFGLKPCHKLPNSNYWHYYIQLNLYLYLAMKEKYFKEDADLSILHIREDDIYPYPIKIDQKIIRKILRRRN